MEQAGIGTPWAVTRLYDGNVVIQTVEVAPDGRMAGVSEELVDQGCQAGVGWSEEFVDFLLKLYFTWC